MKAGWAVTPGAILLTLAANAVAAGSWIAEADLPAIAYRSQRYASPSLAPRSTTPTAGTGITRAHWRYDYDRPGGPVKQVRLCAAGRCVDAGSARGWSDAFAGLPVTTPFRLLVYVPGTGRVRPIMRSGHVQLVVDFE